MFERFNDRARRVVTLAQESARRLGHEKIGTEHLLLGLVYDGEGEAYAALGLSHVYVRARVVDRLGSGEPLTDALPFTPRAKKVLELSLREALQLGQNWIGPGHILLGLLREGESFACTVITEHVDVKTVRRRLLQEMHTSRRRRRFRVVGGRDEVVDEPAPEVGPLLERLAKVEDARLEEARARAVAEAKLERLDALRAELDRAREEIAELKRLLGRGDAS